MKAKVYRPTGEFAREYSEEVHGENYLELAKEFASKLGGKVEADVPMPSKELEPVKEAPVEDVDKDVASEEVDEEPAPIASPDGHVCADCGFEAKTKSGLTLHSKSHK